MRTREELVVVGAVTYSKVGVSSPQIRQPLSGLSIDVQPVVSKPFFALTSACTVVESDPHQGIRPEMNRGDQSLSDEVELTIDLDVSAERGSGQNDPQPQRTPHLPNGDGVGLLIRDGQLESPRSLPLPLGGQDAVQLDIL